jgi:hypothetical protein
MTGLDRVGFVSAGLVFATFCMKQLVPVRALAIMSNLAFTIPFPSDWDGKTT